MAQTNTTSTLDGYFKAIYGDGPINTQADNAILTKMVKFKTADRLGKSYQVPVVLSSEAGFTYLAAGDGLQTLNDSVAAQSKNAEVDGAQLIGRGAIDYEAASKMAGGKAAFAQGSEALVENLMEAANARLEISMLYGRKGLGKFSSTGSSTTRAFQFTAATWAPGIWANKENANIDVYNSSTKINTNAVITIVSVDFDNRKINVSGNATDLTACDSSADGYDVYFKGAYGKEMYGLDAIITNSTTMFGIDAATYAMWSGSSYSAGSADLCMQKVLGAVGKAVAKGGLNEPVVCLVNPVTWMKLNTDQASLRRYDGDSKEKAKNGFQAIEYAGMNGLIEVIAHPGVKQGEAFIFPPKRLKRVGSSDISFQTPGRQGEIFLHIPDKNGYELRLYANQSLFCEQPAKTVKITGIVNS